NIAQLARREGRCRTQLTRLLRLSFLSPKIVEAIVDGTQPKGLTRRLMLSCDLPIDWAEQERLFGLAA
ncbi:MAG: recombinase family protein, partial [Novosphingobium sp.]